jgi:serine protease
MKSRNPLRYSLIAAALFLAAPAMQAADTSPLPTKILSATQPDQTFDRFIVTYRDGTNERSDRSAVLQNVQTAITRAGLDRATISSNGKPVAPLTASYKRKLAVGSDLVHTSRKLSQNEANQLMLQIAADPAVAQVQPDYRRYAVKDFRAPAGAKPQVQAGATAFTPNDPDYAHYQWHFWNTTGGANINNAWELADGSGITVAVLDTGITEHPDLDTSLADDGYDFITDALVSGRNTDDRAPGGWDLGDWTTTQPYLSECTNASNPPEPSSWHGTHVSGTVAELTNNGVGMAGVAYNAKVLPVRVLGHCGGYDSDIADAIVWASGGHVDGVPDNTHPAQVINMSLGGSGKCSASDVSGMAIASALSRGTTVVVAAGNSGADTANFSPASCPGVIAVASNGITGKRAFYSNYGNTVTLSAPGGGIYQNDASSGSQANPDGFVWQAINDGATVPTVADATTSYTGYAGTSQATPHVTGTVAMILSATRAAELPTPTPAQIKTILTSSARAFPVVEDHPIGAGIVDAYAAVKLAVKGDDCTDPNGCEQATVLTKGAILPGQNANAGSSTLYSITVPAGATTLNIRTLGGSGDVSLYVKAGSSVANGGSNADYSSSKPGTSQAIVIPQAQGTTYYIRVATQQGYNNLSILADYAP